MPDKKMHDNEIDIQEVLMGATLGPGLSIVGLKAKMRLSNKLLICTKLQAT